MTDICCMKYRVEFVLLEKIYTTKYVQKGFRTVLDPNL